MEPVFAGSTLGDPRFFNLPYDTIITLINMNNNKPLSAVRSGQYAIKYAHSQRCKENSSEMRITECLWQFNYTHQRKNDIAVEAAEFK